MSLTREELEIENTHLRRLCIRQRQEIDDLLCMADAVECLREIGRKIGCGHVYDSDGRRRLVSCVGDYIERLRGEK